MNTNNVNIKYNCVGTMTNAINKRRNPDSKYIITINNVYVYGYSSLCSNKKHAKQYLGKEIIFCDLFSIIDMYGIENIFNMDIIEVDWKND